MVCVFQALVSVRVSLIEEYFHAHMLRKIITRKSVYSHTSLHTQSLLLAGSFMVGSKEKKRKSKQKSQSGNRNLKISEGNLSFCQTSLAAAAELNS